MYAGRFVVGMGGEAIFVAQKAYAVRWFDANELNMVFGCMASVALLGSSVNQLVMDPLYNAVSARSTSSAAACLGITILLASLADVMSALCACVLYPMDKRRVEQATIELSNNEGIWVFFSLNIKSGKWNLFFGIIKWKLGININ